MRDFKPDQVQVPAFFGGIKFYKIPKYQRPYTWKKDQIIDLWNDLMSTDDSHYLGVVVLKIDRQDSRYEIIDGQQRLITLTLFISLLRNIFRAQGKMDVAESLQELLVRKGYSNSGPVLIVGKHLNDFFKMYIQEFNETNHEDLLKNSFKIALTMESQQLVDNYIELNKLLTSDEEWIKNPEKLLLKIKNLLDETQLLSLTVENEDDAFSLFETLNYKLARLTEIDLIKNRIFMSLTMKRKEERVEQEWDELVINIGGEKRDLTKLDTYLKYFWWSRYDKLPPSRIFKSLRSANIENVFDDLLEDSEYYKPLIQNNTDRLVINHRDLTEIRNVARWMGLRQVNIPLLSLIRLLSRPDFSEFKTPKITQLLDLLPKFVIAYKYSKRSPSVVETKYSRHAIEIFRSKDRTTLDQALANFIADIKNEFPLQEEFNESFDLEYRPNDSYNNSLVAYLLEKIMFPGGELQLKDTDIEHVFPQRPEGGFAPTESALKDRLHSLGNLSPLGKKINQQDCINLRPPEKVKFYKESKVPMIKEIVKILEKQGWSAEVVDWRANELKEKIWSYLISDL